MLFPTASGLSRWGVFRQVDVENEHAGPVISSLVPIKKYVHINIASSHPNEVEKPINRLRKHVIY